MRVKNYKKNGKLERLLKELNELLAPAEQAAIQDYRQPRYPLLLIVGGPRTGSTVMMQWLANTGAFAYPSNLLSRFYGAPYIGAKIQLMLTHPEYNFKDEFEDFTRQLSFESDLGKTRGILAPNDFWYFWRRFIPNTEPVYLEEADLQKVNVRGFLSELAAIEAVFDKPLAMKAMILEQNLPFLAKIFENGIFLYLKRHPFYNIQSLLEAREKFFGTRQRWYSIKPREYDFLSRLEDPIMQVAGQVYYKNKIVQEGLSQLHHSRWLAVDYQDFCRAPARVFRQIREKYRQLGYPAKWEYHGPQEFRSANTIRLPEEDVRKIINAYKKFSGEEMTL